MANYVQLELFDLEPYTSGRPTPELYVVTQEEELSEIEANQLELNLFPDLPTEDDWNMKRAA